MAIARYTMLFDFTTNPVNRQDASAHSGGWSESVWGNPTSDPAFYLRRLAERRGGLLADSCSIIGWRYENFDISGNRLLPQGASSGRFLYPGSQASINMPQDALMCSGSTGTGPNTSRFTLRGLPDTIVVNGEYSPTNGFRLNLDEYFTELRFQWGFIGRVRTNATARVLSINPATGVVELDANVGGGNGDFLRLLRVRGALGAPIQGAFRIQAVAGGNYTCPELVGTDLDTPSGLARLDQVAFFRYSSVVRQRTAVRKVGRPFEQYRGRASRRR